MAPVVRNAPFVSVNTDFSGVNEIALFSTEWRLESGPIERSVQIVAKIAKIL
jgi:hypothetical protein